MIWLALVLVLLGYALSLWIAVMVGFDPTGLDKPELLHDPLTVSILCSLTYLLMGAGIIVGFLQGFWQGIGTLAFLAVIWLVGTEVGHAWMRSIRRNANRTLGKQIYPEE